MIRITRDRVLSWANQILKLLYEEDSVEIFTDDAKLRKTIIDAIEEEFLLYEEIREKAINKITSQKREIPEGSREWDILFFKYFNEELSKLDKIFE